MKLTETEKEELREIFGYTFANVKLALNKSYNHFCAKAGILEHHLDTMTDELEIEMLRKYVLIYKMNKKYLAEFIGITIPTNDFLAVLQIKDDLI